MDTHLRTAMSDIKLGHSHQLTGHFTLVRWTLHISFVDVHSVWIVEFLASTKHHAGSSIKHFVESKSYTSIVVAKSFASH